MTKATSLLEDTGLEVEDILGDSTFATRGAHAHEASLHLEGIRHITRAFVAHPETMLQELVNSALELCGADSACISIEKENPTDSDFYHWIATAGEYSAFLDATLPRYPSACTICLERNRPQLFRVHQRFYDIMGIDAALITDGILFPWHAEDTRGTIFIMAHGRHQAFDLEDYRLVQLLAEFTAMGVRHQQQQKRLIEQAASAAAAAMANDLAHKINNPLQSLTNILYLAASGQGEQDLRAVGEQGLTDLDRLSKLVAQLLTLPYRKLGK
jgi:hypothetical protein